MYSPSVIFLLGSICLHLAVFSPLWQAASFEQGVARGAKSVVPSRTPLQVHLVAQQNTQAEQKEVTAAADAADVPAIGTPASSGAAVASAGYLPAGRLTRVPGPLGDFDLNVALLNDAAITAKIELTVLIDAHGLVADVIVPPQADAKTTSFAQSVAQRFKNARFSPGEIDGKAVQSQLRITVVSEILP